MSHYEASNAAAVRNDFMQNKYRQRADIGAVKNDVTSHIGLTVTLNTLKNWKSYYTELQ